MSYLVSLSLFASLFLPPLLSSFRHTLVSNPNASPRHQPLRSRMDFVRVRAFSNLISPQPPLYYRS